MRAYLDHAATTMPRPEVLEAMSAVLARSLGNSSGLHTAGREARRLLDDARDRLAEVLDAKPSEVVFTSGGTESDHLAIAGVLGAAGGRAVCSAVEHEAVLSIVSATGGAVVLVTDGGAVDLESLESALEDTTSVVSVMLVNNETGVIQPLEEISNLMASKAPRAVLHTDAVQAMNWLDIAVEARSADLVAISGHKFGAPIGTGALVVRDGTPLAAVARGGGQERERRGGTVNVAGAVALSLAAELAASQRVQTSKRVTEMRNRLGDGLRSAIPDLVEPASDSAGNRSGIVPGTLQVCIPGIESEALLFLLDESGIDASAGSACASGALETSHVLSAMKVDDSLARGALRLSLGRTTTDVEVDIALRVIPEAVNQLRSAS